MDLLDSLDAEVSSLVDSMPVEVILALMDKWDHDMERMIRQNLADVDTYRNHYARLKIAWHHVKRRLEFGPGWEWSHDMESKFEQQERYYLSKIKEARRNYYDARIRSEQGQHDEQCTCRGCRCLKGFTRRSEIPSRDRSSGARNHEAGGASGQGAGQTA